MQLLAFVLSVAVARGPDVPLCCGRGAAPVVAHSSAPLLARTSPFAGDVVLALDAAARGPAGQRLSDALAQVRGVARVEVEEVRPIARVWLAGPAAPPVAELAAAARTAGRTAAPAALVRLTFGDAGEKGRVERAGRTLAAVPGVTCLEVEAEGEEAVARVWLRPGVAARDLTAALAAAGISAASR